MRPTDILLLPLHALRILSGYKAFDTPILGSERLNRRGLHVWRVKATNRLAQRRRERLKHLVSPQDRAAFERDGFVEKRNLLKPEDHAALLAELKGLTAPAREMQEGNAITRRIDITPALLAQLPALRRLIETPEWRGLLRYVGGFDIEPLVSIQTIFGQPPADKKSIDPQTRLHADTFHPTMKAWYFLEDVPLEQGPFTYVPGSHALTPRRLAWQKRKSVQASRGRAKGGAFRVPDADLRQLRLPPRRFFAVPGNTLVVGDTFGLHARGPSQQPSIRVEVYASIRPNPWNPFAALDTAWIGRWFDRVSARMGGAETMKDVGTVNPWQKRAEG